MARVGAKKGPDRGRAGASVQRAIDRVNDEARSAFGNVGRFRRFPFRLILRPLHQLRQLRNIYRYPSRLIAREQISGRAPSGFALEIHVSQRLTVIVVSAMVRS